MPIVLVEPANAAPPVADWPEAIDRRTDVALDYVLSGYDVVIPADHMTRAPVLSDRVRTALLVTDLDSLVRAVAWTPAAEIVFAPSPLARLDRLRASRRTLLTARRLTAGAVLTSDDLGTETDGPGIAEALRDAAIGRRVLYDLDVGQPVDFGLLSEEKARSGGAEIL
jgi:hypothetical protein